MLVDIAVADALLAWFCGPSTPECLRSAAANARCRNSYVEQSYGRAVQPRRVPTPSCRAASACPHAETRRRPRHTVTIQAELAAWVSSHHEAVTREPNALACGKLIECRRGVIVVLDTGRLRAMAAKPGKTPRRAGGMVPDVVFHTHTPAARSVHPSKRNKS